MGRNLAVAALPQHGRVRNPLRALLAAVVAAPLVILGYVVAPAALGAGDGLNVAVYNFAPAEFTGDPIAPGIARTDLGRTPCATGTIPSASVDWAQGAPTGAGLVGTCGPDYLLVHATGFLTIPGTYDGSTTVANFESASNDGFSLALTDPTTGSQSTVIDDWQVHAASLFNQSGAVTVKVGMTYDVDIWFFDYQGDASFSLYWEAVPAPVPASALSTVRPLTAQPALAAAVAPGSPTELVFPVGPTSTQLVTSGGDGSGGVTYARVTGPCSVSATGVVTATGNGPCVVAATKAGDSVFSERLAPDFTVPILTPQATLVAVAPVTLAYGGATTLSTTGGSGTGAVTYSAAGTCSVSGAVLTATGVGSCTVTATKAADSTYAQATATAAVVTVKATQTPITLNASGTLTYDPAATATVNLTTSGGSGTGLVSYSAAGPCVLSASSPSGVTVGATGGGPCTITATKATDVNYLVESGSTTLVIGTAVQSPVTVSAANTALTYRASPQATTTLVGAGGSGTGMLSYAVDPVSAGVCSVVTNADTTGTLAAIGTGTCKVTAQRAGDANYSTSVSAPLYISVAAPVATTVVVPSLTVVYGQPINPIQLVAASGGVSPSYASTLPAGLVIDSSTGIVSGTPSAAAAVASYTITATDVNGSTAASVVSITVLRATPTVSWVTQPAAVLTYGAIPTPAYAAVQGAVSPLTYNVATPTVCGIDASTGQFTVLRAGTCSYSANVAADANHEAAAALGTISIDIAAPTAPTGLSLRVQNTTVLASWSDPVSDGGSAIASYTVRATSSGVTSTCTTAGANSTCSLIGLTEGATYTLSVTATNTSLTSGVPGRTSPASASVGVTIPTAAVRYAAGSIGDRYDPTPVTSALDNLSSSDQQVLLAAGIVAAPSIAPVVTITANLTSTSSSVPVTLTIPQTIDSGSEVRVRLQPPSDTPAGAIVRASLRLPSGRTVDLGSTALSVSDVAGGVQLSSFAMVTPGDYLLSVDIVTVAQLGPLRPMAVTGATVTQSIDYAITIVPGKAGVPIIADAPSPSPTPSETPTPEPTPSDTPTPEPSPSVSTDDRGLEIINPLDSPTEVAKTAVTAVALVSAVSAAASAAAAVGAAAGGAASAAGGASGGGGGASGGGSRGGGASGGGGSSSGAGSGGGSASGSGDSGGDTDGADSMANVQTVDVEHEVFEDLTVNWGDALPIWGIAGMKVLDRKSHDLTVALSPISPLLSKLLNDGAYTRALVGAFSAVLPLVAVILAVLGIRSNGDLLLPPPVPLLIGIVIIGVLDAAAGALGIGVFIAGMWLTAGVHTAGDVRMMMGLMIVGFGPALLAGAFRGYRRPAASASDHWWERAVDLAVAPFIGGWATKGMIDALSSLAGVKLPIAESSGTIALAVAGTLMVRVIFEEFAAQYFPSRLNQIHPTDVRPPSALQKSIALAIRAGIFFFVAEAFVGTGWYLYMGTVLFILPNYIGLLQDRFPNYPALYQVLPAGLPGLAASLVIASVSLNALTGILGETPDLAKYAFALLPIPSAIMAFLGMLGREPREGDVRWYQRPRWTWLYRIGGVLMLIYTMRLAGIY